MYTTEVNGHRDYVNMVNFSQSDPNIICSGDIKGIYRVWDIRTNKTVKAYMAPTKESISCSTIEGDKCYIGYGSTLEILDLRSEGMFIKEPIFKYTATDDINRIRIDTNNNRYGFCDDSGCITIFSLDDNKIIIALEGTHTNVCSELSDNTHLHLCSDFVFDRKEKMIYSTGLDMKLIKSKLWNPSVKTKYVMSTLSFQQHSTKMNVNPPMAHSISINNKNNELLVACGNGGVYWVTPGALKIKRHYEVSLGMVQQVCYHDKERNFVVATPDQIQCHCNDTYETLFAKDYVKINDIATSGFTNQILVADHSNNVHLVTPIDSE
ncbi:WD domain containing protein [Entamoeba marina]